MTPRTWLAPIACALLGCSGGYELETCDIRRADCQREVFLAVQDVRGSTWDPWLSMPEMRVISKEQYRAELEAVRTRIDPADAPFDFFTAALKLLHMIDPNEKPEAPTEFSVSFVAAYYEPARYAVTVIDRGKETDRKQDVAKLAHEFVHAAQDRDLSFRALSQGVNTLDGNSALTTLIEGEAQLYENLVDLRQRDLANDAVDWSAYHARYIDGVRKDISESDSPYRLASSGLYYPLGSRYLTAAYEEGGPLAVRRAIAARPRTSVGFMRDDEASGEPCLAPAAPDDYVTRLSATLGAYSLYALATRIWPGDAEPSAWESAGAWSSDRFTVYGDNDSNVAVVWSLQFDGADAASDFQAALAQSGLDETIQSAVQGSRIHLFASSRPLDQFDAWSSCDLRGSN